MSTKIEWCTETWNPIVGCNKVSPGCDNCYAERMARRLKGMSEKYDGAGASIFHRSATGPYAEVISEGFWNGKVSLSESSIYKPTHWKKPRMIFVCSMGDLFHSEVPNIWIDKVMAMAAVFPVHTFIILTKRPARMKKYFKTPKDELLSRWEDAVYELGLSDKHDDPDAPACYLYNRLQDEWPMKNLWLGVTAENQEQANIRIPFLLATPAAKRFVSVEPMLGPVDLSAYYFQKRNGDYPFPYIPEDGRTKIIDCLDWVICGGESGPKARPCHPGWVRSLQVQCRKASTPFFFKQWGEWLPSYDFGYRLDEFPDFKPKAKNQHEFKDGIHMYRVGKKAAGALLDGKEYKEYPKDNI